MAEQILASVYVDECISYLLAELLEKEGWVATSVVREKQLGKSDIEQLLEAKKRKSVFVTSDKKSFLKNIQGVSHNGVVIVSRFVPLDAIVPLKMQIVRLLNQYTADEFEDTVFFVSLGK